MVLSIPKQYYASAECGGLTLILSDAKYMRNAGG